MSSSKTGDITSQDRVIQQRIDMDILDRSTVGLLVLAIVLPLGVFWPYNFLELQPVMSWAFISGMAGISLLRLGHYFISKKLYSRSPIIWQASFGVLSLSHACLLSLLLVLVFKDPAYEPILLPVVLTVCGVASGAVVSLSPRLNLSLIYLVILLVPGMFMGLNVEGQGSNVPIMSLFLVFLTVVGFRANREYIRGFDIEAQLNKQQKELEHINKTDPLTRIYNRGYFNSTYEFQWNNGIRNKIAQSMLLIDIDRFKSVNDVHGHLFGDECLVSIAAVIDETARRNTDLIARFGGEEFVVLLSDTSVTEAFKIAEEIRQKIESHTIEHNDIIMNMTVSVGVASMLPLPGVNPNELTERADKALYEAKNKGRNCVCEYQET